MSFACEMCRGCDSVIEVVGGSGMTGEGVCSGSRVVRLLLLHGVAPAYQQWQQGLSSRRKAVCSRYRVVQVVYSLLSDSIIRSQLIMLYRIC